MRNIIIFILLVFVNFPTYALENTSRSCNSLSGPVNPLFTPAYKDKDGTLSFRPFFKIDWQAIAPEWITEIDWKNPTQANMNLLRENMYYESSAALIYDAALDCTTSIGNYYLISDAGISPVELSKLRGRTKYSISGNKIQDKPRYEGDIKFSPPSATVNEGGFIMLSWAKSNEDMRLRIFPNPSFDVSEEGGRITYRYRALGKELKATYQWNAETSHPLKIIKMYKFRMNTNEYIYVRWEANENYCSFNATLFEVSIFGSDPYLRKESSIGYGCGWL